MSKKRFYKICFQFFSVGYYGSGSDPNNRSWSPSPVLVYILPSLYWGKFSMCLGEGGLWAKSLFCSTLLLIFIFIWIELKVLLCWMVEWITDNFHKILTTHGLIQPPPHIIGVDKIYRVSVSFLPSWKVCSSPPSKPASQVTSTLPGLVEFMEHPCGGSGGPDNILYVQDVSSYFIW